MRVAILTAALLGGTAYAESASSAETCSKSQTGGSCVTGDSMLQAAQLQKRRSMALVEHAPAPGFCALKSTGCPVTCSPTDHMCTMPPFHKGGTAHNWCSPTPCPVTCTMYEVMCPFMPPPGCTGDACMGPDTCAPKSIGCLVACQPNENMCTTPGPTEHDAATNWCSSAPCPVTCKPDELHCPFMPPPACMGDACMGPATCAAKSAGCPVACSGTDHMCHSPPTYPGGDGHNWCSPMPCPVTCSTDEVHCPFMAPPGCTGDACMGQDTCAPKSTGCPVHCQPNDNVCSTPGATEHDAPTNWCSSAPCPVTCKHDELHCPFMPPPGCVGDACMGPDTCAPKSTGCPVTCQPTDHMCSTPPPTKDGSATNWCSPTPCPVTCSTDEVQCPFMAPPGCTGDACMGPDTCVPKSIGCPVTCQPTDHMCSTPPATKDVSATNWCSPTPCPVTCSTDEVQCPFMAPPGCTGDACMGQDTCAPKSTGCPVACSGTEQMCHTPPTYPGGSAHNWCSPTPCPVTCKSDEVNCPFMPPPSCTGDACMGPETCAPKSTGCPVTCQPHEHTCSTPPPFKDGAAHNWCSHSPCPITCKPEEVLCPAMN